MKKLERRRQFFRSLEAKSLRSRPFFTQVADDLTMYTGSPTFLFLNILFFVLWISLNIGLFPNLIPFDPFPFGLLTLIVSLEAIVLAIFVLISQNRAAKINTIREEVHLRVNLIAEEEITKVLEILADMKKKMDIRKQDPELDHMLERINTNYIENSIAEQLSRANKSLTDQLKKDFPDILVNVIKKPIELVNGGGSHNHEKKRVVSTD